MDTENCCCAVIAAAGASTRMGSPDSKQFARLLDLPAIVYTLRAFEEACSVHSIVIVCRTDDMGRMSSMARRYGIRKVVALVPGGKTRQESVAAGLSAVPADARWLAVHDGARPLVTPEAIDFCVQDATATGASALGVPVKDTVKVLDENRFVVSTPPRSLLWSVQTPQVFERAVYEKALALARAEKLDFTDDCQLLEHDGKKVHLCMGSYENIKLTTPEDILTAEMILRRREAAK